MYIFIQLCVANILYQNFSDLSIADFIDILGKLLYNLNNIYFKEKKPMNTWDLSYFYKNDEEFARDFDSLGEYLPRLGAYKGSLSDEAKLKEYFLLSEELEKKLFRVYQYASLKSDLNKKDTASAASVARVMMLLANLEEVTSFEAPEILSLGRKKVFEFIDKNPEFESYRFIMEKLFRGNKHVLKEDREKLLSYYSPVANEGSELYSKLAVADAKNKTVKLSSGEKVTVTQGNWRALIADAPVASDRKKIFEAIFSAYGDSKNTYAEIYNLVMKSELANVKARGYSSILSSHLFGNNIPESVFTTLIGVAGKYTKSLKKYYKLRKKYLGLKAHRSYDRFIELAHSDKKYSYEEAKELFFKSIENTPDDFQAKAREVLREGFVDVYEQDGKRSGAYSSSIADAHPFILLNYTDTLDDVFTVVHEAGHSIHTLYSHEAQPTKLQQYTIFVAEIASTFNEHMLLDHLIKSGNTTREEKIMLLQKAIDEIVATFYRQSLFATYEYEVSRMIEEDKPIDHEVLSSLMIDLYKKYYGIDISKENVKQYVWAYIPHLFYTPFYVYQYATSFAASFALYSAVKECKEGAFENYINLLKSGGSKYPMDQAREAGIDFKKKETFMAVVRRLDELVDMLEKELY